MGTYLIAHDLGTSGDKVTLFSAEGKLIGSTISAYDTHYFNDVWVEQNAEDWWQAVGRGTKLLLEQSGIRASEVAAVSFSGQMMGCLCVDSQGNPLRPSIIWADQRAVAQSAAIEEKISQFDFYHITGHRNTPSYGVQKLMWIKENQPEIYEKTAFVLNAKDYIVYKLTGRFCTDPSDANSMACFDINTCTWSEEIIRCAGIDRDKLPEIVPSTYRVGGVTAEAAAFTGLAEGTAVVMGGGDGVVANVGCGSIVPGNTYCCLGTSAWVTTTSEKPIFDPEMRTVTWAHAVPGLYAPNGTMQYAGGSYSWLKNTICTEEIARGLAERKSPFTYINQQIETSPIGANGVIFLPYLLGERAPRWDPDVRGSWLGIKPENTRADILRSVLEGVTMNLGICLDILKSHIPIEEVTVIGGGAKGDVWQQMLADIWNVRIRVPRLLDEAGSMGAAVLAGVGAGIYQDVSAIYQYMEFVQAREPRPEATAAYQSCKRQFNAFYEALTPVYHNIAMEKMMK